MPLATLLGGLTSYPVCQDEARRLRGTGATRISAPCAAKEPGTPRGWLSDPDLRAGPIDDDRTIVLIGARPDQVGQMTAHVGRPHPSLVSLVRPL